MRHNFDLLLRDFRQALARPDDPDREWNLRTAARNIGSTVARFRGAFPFLTGYYVSRDESPTGEIVDKLLALSQAANSRTVVFGALNVLVETGVIGELEALPQLDDWKEKHWRR
jgi:hypothetical protein